MGPEDFPKDISNTPREPEVPPEEENVEAPPEGPDADFPPQEAEIVSPEAPEDITSPDADPPAKTPEHTLEEKADQKEQLAQAPEQPQEQEQKTESGELKIEREKVKELAEAAKKAGVSPLPHVISVSLGYADPEIRKNLIEKTGSAEGVVAADVEKLPFRDGTFTKIVAVHLFTHLTEEKLRGAVAEVERILAPNGTLVIVPVLVPKEKGDYTFDLTQAEADNLKIRAMEDTWVRRSVHLSGLISQQFAGKGKVTMSDLTPEIGSETQLYKLRRITAEKGE